MVWQHLTAFGNAASEAWQLRARIQRLDQSSLTLNFELLAPAAELIWPVAAPASNRCDELWHSTCLEVFIAKPGDANYWEVNLSPRGDWNVYQLDDYRKGLRPETSIGSIPIRSTSEPDRHQLQATLALPMLCFPIHGWVQTITFFMPALMLTTTNVASNLKCFRCAWYSL